MHQHATQWKTQLILAVMFIGIVLLMTIPSYQLLVKPRGEAFDLFWIWAGGQAVLSGENPYGPETTRIIQLGVFKKIIPPEDYQHGFPHPAHITFVLFPFTAPPFFWSILFWVSLQIPLFMVTLLLGFNLLEWSVRPATLFGLAILTTLGFRYPINVYILGQLIFFVMFFALLSIWLYQHDHPRGAAIALALTTIRPDLSLLAILLAFMMVRNSAKRTEFIATLLVCGLISLLLPALFIGFWPITWLTAIFSYGSNPFATWPPELLPISWLGLALTGLLALWLVRTLSLAWRKARAYHYALAISATTLFGLISLPQTGSYSLTIALIPALILMHYAVSSWLQALIAVSLLTPWLYFSLGQSFDRLIFLLIPLQFVIFQEIVVYQNREQSEDHDSLAASNRNS